MFIENSMFLCSGGSGCCLTQDISLLWSCVVGVLQVYKHSAPPELWRFGARGVTVRLRFKSDRPSFFGHISHL